MKAQKEKQQKKPILRENKGSIGSKSKKNSLGWKVKIKKPLR